jgi:hypothetical protein
MYDGSDKCGEGGPVCFDPNVTHHMNLYDVGMTALYLSDTEALIALAEVAGRFDIVPELQLRFARVQTAMNAHMWNPATGMYTNVLYNGSFYSRFAPTSFFPLMSGSATDAQADAMMATFTSPLGFCFNRSHTPDANAAMLVQWCVPLTPARARPSASDFHHGAGAFAAGVETDRRTFPEHAAVAGILGVEGAVAVAQAAASQHVVAAAEHDAGDLAPLVHEMPGIVVHRVEVGRGDAVDQGAQLLHLGARSGR